MGFADFPPRRRRASSNKRPLVPALVGAIALALVLLGAPAAAADVGDPLSYFGGPVVHSMQGVVVDWGPDVNPIYTDDANGDPGLIEYLQHSSGSTGTFSGVLAQYMDRFGNAQPNVSYGGKATITPSVTSSTIDDQQIQDELVSQIDSGNLPQPSGRRGLGTVYLVLFPAGDTECLNSDDTFCSGSDFCAYHGNARLADGTAVLYAVLPDNTSGPMSQACGQASTPLANQTSFLSHEWSEAITDPLVGEATSSNAWPLAWYDDACGGVSSVCGEIGDKCDGEQATSGGWTVQLEWSNLDASCESSEPSYSQPTAAFTAGASAYVGQPMTFDASGSSDPSSNTTSMTYQGTPYTIGSGISTYTWDWDGTTADTGETATHTFDAPGLYQVSLSVVDNLGFTSTVTHPVVVWSNSQPTPPDVSTMPASAIDSGDATLNGTINDHDQPVLYSFAYGTAPDALNQSTPATPLEQSNDPFTAPFTVSGLSPSTTYYYRLDVQIAGQTFSGQVQSFTTLAAPSIQQNPNPGGSSGSGSSSPTPAPPPSAPQLPSAVTGGVSGRSSSGATVVGSVDPNGHLTSYHVEFGTSTAYGHSSALASAGAGTSSIAVRATLSGLRPRTVYHYRLVATSAAGTAVGADRKFKTPAAPPRPPRFSFTAPLRMTMNQALAGKLRVRFHCSTACTAHFTVTIALTGLRRAQVIPVMLARGTGRIRRAGAGQAKLVLTSAGRRALRRARSIKLVISGYAVRGNSKPSPPRTVRLTLKR